MVDFSLFEKVLTRREKKIENRYKLVQTGTNRYKPVQTGMNPYKLVQTGIGNAAQKKPDDTHWVFLILCLERLEEVKFEQKEAEKQLS